MKVYEASKAIYGRWMTEWALVEPSIRYVFDNDAQPQSVPSYVRVGLKWLSSRQTTIGQSRKYRRDGLLNVKVNVPINAGRETAELLAEKVKVIFEGQRFGTSGAEPEGVICSLATFNELGPDASFFSLLVAIDFHVYDTH